MGHVETSSIDWSALRVQEHLSVPERISIDIEKLIWSGQLQPGEKIPSERLLADSLGVSRVSVRQALLELENRGLLDRKPGRGTVVVSPTSPKTKEGEVLARVLSGLERVGKKDFSDLMELRYVLEPPIAGITAIRRSKRDIQQLSDLINEMKQQTNPVKYAELDRAFHQAIAQYTHNPHLALLNEQIAILIAPMRDTALQTKSRMAISSVAHQNIFDAIKAGNQQAAELAAREHVKTVWDAISKQVTEAS